MSTASLLLGLGIIVGGTAWALVVAWLSEKYEDA